MIEVETYIDLESLFHFATRVRTLVCAAYSQFRSGASLPAFPGNVCVACNGENVSFGLAICAERACILAVTGTEVKMFGAIALIADLRNY